MKSTILLFIIVLIIPQIIYAQWGEDVFIDGQNYVSDPRIGANGDTLHVVYHGGDPYKIFYCRSTDGGFNWESPQVIIEQEVTGFWSPTIAVIQNNVLVAAQKRHDEIRCRRSTDGGETWEEPFPLYRYHGNLLTFPRFATEAPNIYCSIDGTIDGTSVFHLIKSTDNGNSWDGGRLIFYGGALK